jgi:hypothetical protein
MMVTLRRHLPVHIAGSRDFPGGSGRDTRLNMITECGRKEFDWTGFLTWQGERLRRRAPS